MSEKTRIEQSIISQCLEPGSILDALRENRFHEEGYQKLYETVDEYRKFLGDDPMISREIAGYLCTINDLLVSTAIYYEYQSQVSDEGREIQQAWNDFVLLLSKIFFVNT